MTTSAIFRRQLREELEAAEEQGQSHVDINSGDLHRMVGGYPGTNHRMPVCCEVMYGEMQSDDEVVAAPPKGKGASLTIRYRLSRAGSYVAQASTTPDAVEVMPVAAKKTTAIVLTLILVALLAIVVTLSANAQQISSSVEDGGSVDTYGTDNTGSSLHRSWVIVNDSKCPVELSGVGIKTDYGSVHVFKSAGFANMRLDVVAFEIRFLLYDMFGNHIKTLSSTKVKDVATGDSFYLESVDYYWHASVNQTSEFLTSIAFVAQARTAEGKIWNYDAKGIVRELEKIEIKIDFGLLEPSHG